VYLKEARRPAGDWRSLDSTGPNATGSDASYVVTIPLVLLWGPGSGLSDCIRPVPTLHPFEIRANEVPISQCFVPDEHKYVL
jgi:hypothetical protein